MRGRNGAVVVVVVILVSSLSFAFPGAGTIGDPALENLDRGGPWEPTDGGGAWKPAERVEEPEEPVIQPPLTGLESLHQTGIDGDGVTVGVVGQQFTAGERALGEAVVERRRFGASDPLLSSAGSLLSRGSHDTAVAEIVARTAPDSELYLADVGRETTPERYAEAVSWLLENDVDVVVDAASYFPATAEGMERLNAVASDASDQGVVFVTSAGNYANRHWAGTVDDEGWVEFAPETPYNTLGEGPISGETSLRLYWEGDAEFDLYLYRVDPGEDTLVAKSATNQSGDGAHSEAIDARLPKGSYYVAVEAGDGANGTHVELFVAQHEFSATSQEGGMVAPATAENVIAVGAIDSVSGEPQPYSSSGPMLDISAPDGARTAAAGELHGSSAAAPLVAGTVALMLSENESLTPTEAQRALERTATRVDGRLYLDAVGAVDAVSHQEVRHPIRPVSGSDLDERYAGTDETRPVPPFAETETDRTVNESATTEAVSAEPVAPDDTGWNPPPSGVIGD